MAIQQFLILEGCDVMLTINGLSPFPKDLIFNNKNKNKFFEKNILKKFLLF
tara:strand:- start:280 stop:432 length:153 start_codon:yes stop_codon:yes gene_type:complete